MNQTIFLIFSMLAFLSGANQKKDTNSIRPGKDIALFFVVEDYDHWEKLKFPIDDAEQIASTLEQDYDFETQIVRNPTWNTIDKTLRQYIKRNYAKDAQLLIWFGGHGDFDSVLERGYFIAKDGGKDTRAKWFSFTDLEQYLKKIRCEHILLSIDACYSGTFDQALAMRGPPKFGRPNPSGQSKRDIFIEEELELRTRLFIASGKKERVPDRSDFATYFKRALRQHGGADYLVSFPHLEAELRKARPRPHITSFAGNQEESNFLFVGKKREIDPLDEQLWQMAKNLDDLGLYQNHKKLYPSSPHTAARTAAIQRLQATTVPSTNPSKNTPTTTAFHDDRMVFVKGGTYTMGCKKERDGNCEDNEKAHTVTLSDFYIGRYEVTQSEWKKIMGDNPSDNKNCDTCPVENVSWEDVQEYIKKLNQKTGLKYRLPTEAEWEYAARGGEKSKDYQYAGTSNVNELYKYANFCDKSCTYNWKIKTQNDGYKITAPVGTYQPNELGLYDMSGNIWEWCSDWYDKDYYKNSPQQNPKGADSGSYRVVRGGSWYNGPADQRVANRLFGSPSLRLYDVGFRISRAAL